MFTLIVTHHAKRAGQAQQGFVPPPGSPSGGMSRRSNRDYIFRLEAFLPWGDIKLYPLPLGQGTKTLGLDVAVVNENIVTFFTLDKPKAFLIIEPFYGSGFPVGHDS